MINLGELAPAILRGLLDSGRVDLEANFSKGEIIQGRVVRLLGQHGAVVRLRGMELTAATATILAKGQSILVRVDQLKPQFIVSLMLNDTPAQEKTASLLRLYLPSAMEISSVIKNLEKIKAQLPREALRNSGLEKVMEELGKALRNPSGGKRSLLSILGFSHEAELANGKPTQNLKRSLFILQRNLERLMAKDPSLYRNALKEIKEAAQNIELRQLMNLSEREETKSWEIPYWNGQEIATAKLYVKRGGKGRKGKKKEETVKITLMLDMSRIGRVRVEAIKSRKIIDGVIYVGTRSAVREMKEQLPSLVDKLHELGFVSEISVQRATDDYLTQKPIEDGHLPVKGLLNVRV